MDKAHKNYTESANNDKIKWKTALQELYDAYERIREEEAMSRLKTQWMDKVQGEMEGSE